MTMITQTAVLQIRLLVDERQAWSAECECSDPSLFPMEEIERVMGRAQAELAALYVARNGAQSA